MEFDKSAFLNDLKIKKAPQKRGSMTIIGTTKFSCRNFISSCSFMSFKYIKI